MSVLYTLYESFNSSFFDSKLPAAGEVTIEYSSRLTASAGICYPGKKVIRLSTHYHLKFPEQAASTLLHEMVHFIVPGHGAAFREWMRRINNSGGSVALRSIERSTKASFKWKYVCTKCKKEYLRKRRLKSKGKHFLCGSCKSRLHELML